MNSTPHLLQDHNSFSRTSLHQMTSSGSSSPTQQLVSANHSLFNQWNQDHDSSHTGQSSNTPSVLNSVHASSSTLGSNHSFIFVEDSLSMSQNSNLTTRRTKQRKTKNSASATTTPNKSTGHVQVTVFHHHHYMSSKNSSRSTNSSKKKNPNKIETSDEEEQKKALSKLNPRAKIEKKSHSKSGLQYTVVKEEVVSCKDGGEVNYEMALEDGFIWWSWY
ncbi:hypothetical protein C9374_007790 [Naegleria lovaniensis]|uniref:Uncharacterized protein n=1 Tax=Naegleria lovaniensis TaxID=51637 RepID=A0AA88KGE9_NAELO|nr:uncharacterized protein C9374_007790 [Naegleria lovaniensis]KAG2379152.1 hypothetical protein C9374_007790 [Naegleria lovaniensis]